MGNRRVRIYRGETAASNIIGFSASAVPEKDSLETFLLEHEYRHQELQTDNLEQPEYTQRIQQLLGSIGCVSFRPIQIEPPLRDKDIPALAAWCAENIDPSHNSGYLIDNRVQPPMSETNLSTDGVYLAKW